MAGNTMLWTCLAVGTPLPPSPSPTSLRQAFAPLQHNGEDMTLVEAMQPWDLCTEVRGDRWGGERCSLLLLLLVVVVVLQKMGVGPVIGGADVV